MVDGVGGKDGLDKSGASRHRNKFSIPSWDLPGGRYQKAPNRKRKPKIPHGERSPLNPNTVDNVMTVDLPIVGGMTPGRVKGYSDTVSICGPRGLVNRVTS